MSADRKIVLVYETGMGRGGSKRSLLNWLEMLRASGEFEVKILLGMEGWMAERLRERGFAVELVPMPAALTAVKHGSWSRRGRTLGRVLQMLGGVCAAWLRTLAMRADAVLLTGGRDFIMIAPLVWRLRSRTATIPQSTDWGEIPICKTMCRVAGHTLAISRTVADSIVAMGIPARKVEVLPLIASKDRSAEAPSRAVARARLGLPENAPVIGLTGVVREQKGQREAILAFREVAKTLPQARLVIVGAPQADQPDAIAYDREIRALAATPELRGRVLFTGWRDDAVDLLRGFDVLLAPSLHSEGVPRVIVEGLEAGLHVIATDIPQLRETLGGVGALCPAGDAGAWARAITDALSDPARLAREARRARARWEECFSDTVNTPKLLARFRRLAGGPDFES
jgi:glycosyltransferase involved in cell wall biosynthesis